MGSHRQMQLIISGQHAPPQRPLASNSAPVSQARVIQFVIMAHGSIGPGMARLERIGIRFLAQAQRCLLPC
jgi:hypothetical protein